MSSEAINFQLLNTMHHALKSKSFKQLSYYRCTGGLQKINLVIVLLTIQKFKEHIDSKTISKPFVDICEASQGICVMYLDCLYW